jgi:hypothetical protein
MEQNPQPTENVKHLENTPAVQNASSTLLVIGLVIGIFGAIAMVSYFFFAKTYSAKMEERKENALLYDDPSQKNILGAQITDLPELEMGGNKALNKQPTMTQQQLMQQQLMRQQQQAAGGMQQQKAPQNMPENKPPTPTQTPIPENTYVNDELHFKLEYQGWDKQTQTTDGDLKIDSYKKSDGSLILYIVTTTKKFDTIQAFIDTSPRGRKPATTANFGIGGKEGQKSEPFDVSENGTAYKAIAAYVEPKDDQGMISIELDSTSLDVNDHTAADAFEKITDSFAFIEKKTP